MSVIAQCRLSRLCCQRYSPEFFDLSWTREPVPLESAVDKALRGAGSLALFEHMNVGYTSHKCGRYSDPNTLNVQNRLHIWARVGVGCEGMVHTLQPLLQFAYLLNEVEQSWLYQHWSVPVSIVHESCVSPGVLAVLRVSPVWGASSYHYRQGSVHPHRRHLSLSAARRL